MDLGKIVIGAIIYMVWAVLIGYLVIYLLTWAIIIAALAAGIYAGFGAKTHRGITNGFMAGLIGGIILGTASIYTPTVYGIPLSVSIANFLTPVIDITTTISWLSIPTLAVIGSIFGAMGGLLGSISRLRKIFLFLTLFTLFLFYLALDNVAWYWETYPWNWSLSHVLTHWVDITVSLVFAFAVVVLAHILKIYE